MQEVTVDVNVLFKQITACLQLRPARTCQAAADKDKAAAEEEVGSDAGIPLYGYSHAVNCYKTQKLEWQRRVLDEYCKLAAAYNQD